ncbi:hypothetical protein GCM10020331_010820 [Ectobacillus funiculus]
MKNKTVTDVTEELIQDILDREYIWQINVIDPDYEAAANHSVQAWLPPQAHDVLFDLATEHLSSIRHVAYSLLVHALRGKRGESMNEYSKHDLIGQELEAEEETSAWKKI